MKMICFDMDGTIVDLYGVGDWLQCLRNENPLPYEIADPLVNMADLRDLLLKLKARGWEIRVISWLSKDSSDWYKNAVRQAKRDWLEQYNFPFDAVHLIQYGATKADCVRRIVQNDEGILIDDDNDIRSGWRLGRTYNPAEYDIFKILEELLA